MAGRMSAQKNPLATVRALGILKELQWHCVILGDGPLLGEVREEAIRLGIAGRIDFRGWATASEVTSAMKISDVLLIPSLSEGLPMVAVEALSHGLSIVGSRIGGLVDVAVESGKGKNADLYNLAEGEEGLARAIKAMIGNPESLLECRTSSLAMALRFDLERSLNDYEELLGKVVRGDA